MSDQKPPSGNPLPNQRVWDRICAFFIEVQIAAQMLAQGVPAQPPLEDLTSAQYAVGKLFTAVDELFRNLNCPAEILELTRLPQLAWHRAAWGIPDPLLAPADVPGRKAADVPMTIFRALVLAQVDDLTGIYPSWRAAAQAVSDALRRAKAPEGCTPDVKTIQNWHSEAADPKTPTEQHLADAYAHYRRRQWPETAGAGLDERIEWIIAGYSASVA
jgi:hypothetical protein